MSASPPPLRVYLGYAPGCGKTTRLLQDAHALAARGVDVVVGWVEPRGRPEVAALCAGLERVPPRRVVAHGLSLDEFDCEALLARRPAVALVDDLAHANAPGVGHLRRHQDVAALLDAGIRVLSACDVQRLESLKDVVARVVGVDERVGVPSPLLERAEVVALDLSVSDLASRAGAPASGPTEALVALRELMLREAASRARPRAGPPVQRASPAMPGRVMVALSSLSPRAGTLLRHGARFAGRLDTSWFVVYVETPGEAPERIDGEAERALLANVALARELGAEVVWRKARDPLSALLDFGRSHGVRHLLIGRSRRRTWRTLLKRPPGASLASVLRGPFHERLLRQARDFDVYVVADESEGA